MSFSDPYQAYVEGSVFSGNPLGTVIALYEGTIECVQHARGCLGSGDIWGRSKSINKGVALLTELLVSLDHNQGGEISANLKRLYSYIQCRLLEAHMKQIHEPLQEAERLLNTMLEGWREAAEKLQNESHSAASIGGESSWQESKDETPVFAYNFFSEAAEFAGGISATF